MIQVAELQIGDWVLWSEQKSNIDGDYDLNWFPKQIELSDFVFAAENDWNEHDWNEFVKPIPLTEEILEANGFEYSRAESYDRSRFYRFPKDCALYKWSSFGVEHFIDGRCYKITDHVFIAIHYVHELQNTLRLCGLHDLTNNFKIK